MKEIVWQVGVLAGKELVASKEMADRCRQRLVPDRPRIRPAATTGASGGGGEAPPHQCRPPPPPPQPPLPRLLLLVLCRRR